VCICRHLFVDIVLLSSFNATTAVDAGYNVFLQSNGTIEFRANETSRLLYLVLGVDTNPEVGASLDVVLTSVTDGGVLAPGRRHANVFVNESDSPRGGVGVVQVDNASTVTVEAPPEAGNTETIIEVPIARLADAFGETLSVSYVVSDGVASSPADAGLGLAFPASTRFASTSGHVVVGPYACCSLQSATLAVALVGDGTPTVGATYTLTLVSTNSTNGVVVTANEATFVIHVGPTADAYGSVSVTGCSVEVGSSSTSGGGGTSSSSRFLTMQFARLGGLFRDMTTMFSVLHNDGQTGRVSATPAELYVNPNQDRIAVFTNGTSTSNVTLELRSSAPLDEGDVFEVRVLGATVSLFGNVTVDLASSVTSVDTSMARGCVMSSIHCPTLVSHCA
jgi:hypothetical protein